MARVKICGLTTVQDAHVAAEAGAHYLGFIFYEKSPRYVSYERYAEFSEQLPAGVLRVGVFVNANPLLITRLFSEKRIEVAQLHGEEPAKAVNMYPAAYKAIRPPDEPELRRLAEVYRLNQPDVDLPTLLIDTYHPTLHGGTGQTVNLGVAELAKSLTPRLMLAGGLTPENVGEVVSTINPFAVDVSSGVEASPGVKDHAKVRAFVKAALSVRV
jgi:phosphoribosylanthranilate isomerase